MIITLKIYENIMKIKVYWKYILSFSKYWKKNNFKDWKETNMPWIINREKKKKLTRYLFPIVTACSFFFNRFWFQYPLPFVSIVFFPAPLLPLWSLFFFHYSERRIKDEFSFPFWISLSTGDSSKSLSLSV